MTMPFNEYKLPYGFGVIASNQTGMKFEYDNLLVTKMIHEFQRKIMELQDNLLVKGLSVESLMKLKAMIEKELKDREAK